MNIFLNLLFINLFVVLVHEAGFFGHLDDWVNSKFKFRHLPYIFLCALCQTFWLSLLYIIISGPIALWMIPLCVLNGLLTRVTQPLYRLIENILLKVIELLNKWLKL